MPNSPAAAARRIRWIVVLIVFMLALATLYMMFVPRHPGRRISAEQSPAAIHPR